jgi:alkylation response protein AidB-like acyl-CoA dehydrogenase
LGEEGDAWAIISYSLANERVGIPRYELASRVLDGMVGELQAQGRLADSASRARAGSAAARCEAARILVHRTVDRRAHGQALGAEASIARVAVAEADHAVTDFAFDHLPEAFSGTAHLAVQTHHERAIVTGIAAGAAEIQLGMIAQRWLNLPRESA